MKHLYSIIFLFSVVSFISAKDKYNGNVFSTESKFIYDACLSVDGKVIVCSDNNTLKAFTVENKELLGNFSGGHRSKVLCVAISPDGTMVASGGGDSNVVVWDFNTHVIIQRITFATGKITSIKFSPDNRFILFGCSNSPAYLYAIKEQKKVKEFTDQQLDVTSVAFSSDGSLIAIAGGDKVIRLYNTSDFQLKSKLKGHTNWVRSIIFYNHDKNLISCGDDKKVIQWNLSTLAYKKKTILLKNWILCVDIDNEIVNRTNMYVVGTMNGSIQIDYSLGSYEAKLSSPISKVIFLPNKSGLIEIVAATLGSGLMSISAANMPISK
ncbi:MAG TPA: WD40 repeat domain-containing protein [Clostridia bacterium]|nr:WD40 repeat domain-containing protein [Clostridia bacterium]